MGGDSACHELSVLLSSPGLGGEVGAGGTLFSPGWEDCILLNVLNIKERVGFLPWSRWVRFVIISHHSVLRKHVIVWLLLGAWKAVKTEFVMVVFRCFFLCFLRTWR